LLSIFRRDRARNLLAIAFLRYATAASSTPLFPYGFDIAAVVLVVATSIVVAAVVTITIAWECMRGRRWR